MHMYRFIRLCIFLFISTVTLVAQPLKEKVDTTDNKFLSHFLGINYEKVTRTRDKAYEEKLKHHILTENGFTIAFEEECIAEGKKPKIAGTLETSQDVDRLFDDLEDGKYES